MHYKPEQLYRHDRFEKMKFIVDVYVAQGNKAIPKSIFTHIHNATWRHSDVW